MEIAKKKGKILMDFDYENDEKKPHCPVVDVDGVIANGKQFDLDITLPNDE